jgi:hypothetical protein
VVDSSDPLVISSTNSAHNQTSSSTIRCVDPAATNVAIVGGNFFRKYRVALASRTLKGENFANFFRESGAPRANMGRDAGRDETPLQLSKAASARKTFNPAT